MVLGQKLRELGDIPPIGRVLIWNGYLTNTISSCIPFITCSRLLNYRTLEYVRDTNLALVLNTNELILFDTVNMMQKRDSIIILENITNRKVSYGRRVSCISLHGLVTRTVTCACLDLDC